MIREIINFTNDLLKDIPDIMQWKAKPDKGLHVFIDIDANGNWTNRQLIKGQDYDYYDGSNEDIKLWTDCCRFQEASSYISMQKVSKFDKKKKIHSCSPFSLAYNFHYNKDSDKQEAGIKVFKRSDHPSKDDIEENNKLIRQKRYELIKSRLKDYERNAIKMYGLNMSDYKDDLFAEQPYKYKKQIVGFFSSIPDIMDTVCTLPEYTLLVDKDYLHIYLRSVPIEEQERLHRSYFRNDIFGGDTLTEDFGSVAFFTAYDSKKIFLRHKTSYLKDGVSQRFSADDALALHAFEQLLGRKNCLPNPLPIVVDKREINKKIVSLFNESEEPLSFHALLKQLFKAANIRSLSDFYLLNCRRTGNGIVIDDFDFVPQFRYMMEDGTMIYNLTDAGITKDKVLNMFPDKKIRTIFDFESIVVKDIFNNSLVKVKDRNYSSSYFGEINPKYVVGGNLMAGLILKYRKDIYAYIYKSKTNAINQRMFDDMMYQSILSNIHDDDVEYRFFDSNNNIKNKINIWFSLYGLFSQSNNNSLMASRVTELRETMRKVANGEAYLPSDEAFAFGAGQLVSYLIDRSAASNKTYAMLEPYLQKSKISQLQAAISQTIGTYKHDIKVGKGRFEHLAADVITYDSNADMKPLLKYFLAGCFCPCVIYEKKDNDNKENEE